MNSHPKLFERVFVGLCRLYQTVNAECRDDANSDEDCVLDKLAHKFLLGIFFNKDICFLRKGQEKKLLFRDNHANHGEFLVHLVFTRDDFAFEHLAIEFLHKEFELAAFKA